MLGSSSIQSFSFFLFPSIQSFKISTHLIHTHLFFVSRAYSEIKMEFEKVNYLMIPSHMIDLQKLLNRYITSKLNSF